MLRTISHFIISVALLRRSLPIPQASTLLMKVRPSSIRRCMGCACAPRFQARRKFGRKGRSAPRTRGKCGRHTARTKPQDTTSCVWTPSHADGTRPSIRLSHRPRPLTNGTLPSMPEECARHRTREDPCDVFEYECQALCA